MKRFVASLALVTLMITAPIAAAESMPDFGSDSGDYANDGECDDPRFAGDGMTGTLLLDEDIKADATDCKEAWSSGTLHLVGASKPVADASEPDFGEDDSMFANDGECDDPRFSGKGMTGTTLLDGDKMSDATDCRAAWRAGKLQLATAPASAVKPASDVDFGDDDGMYAEDGECDDPRFVGDGMTDTPLLASDRLHDASDCQAAYQKGTNRLK